MNNRTMTYGPQGPRRPRSIFRPADWRVTVSELNHTVLILDGKAMRVLAPGRYRFNPLRAQYWTAPASPQAVIIPGQEMLTSDGAAVRITVAAVLRVTDPMAAYRAGQWMESLYLEIQIALRNTVATLGLEELLANRSALDISLSNAGEVAGARLGVEVESVRVRDLIAPGELKRAVAEVVQARLAGQAALERARGESAALRSLANAARSAADNPALLQLRLIQQMETTRGNTYVLGTGTLPTLPTP